MTEVESAPLGRGYLRSAGLVAVARIAPLAVQLLVTPTVIAVAGVPSYAVWALLTTTINLLLTADLGVVAIMLRYHGVARGRGDAALGARVTTTVLLVLGVLLVMVTLLGPFIADLALAVIRIDPSLTAEARVVFTQAGTLAVLQLIGLALGSYLAAFERFGQMAAMSLIARAGGAAAILIALFGGWGLVGLVGAAYVDALLAVILGVIFCWSHLTRELRGWVHRAEARELWGYAWRNQASALGFIVQRESDLILAAILLPAALQSEIASSAQLATAAALAPTVLLIPLFSRLSRLAGADPAGAVRSSRDAETNWISFIAPFSAVVLVSLPLFASSWLGPAIHQSYEVSALLVAGFLLVLLNSVRSTLVRSIGRPGLETWSFVAILAVKLAIGIPAALILGALGLAASTIVASLAGVVTLWLLSARRIPGLSAGALRRRPALAAAVTLVVGSAVSLVVHFLAIDRWLTLGISVGLALVLAAMSIAVVLPDGRDRRREQGLG
ncbi:MAG TPA: hypothetical protein VGM70_12680 [Pseudolysinimonas sp.]|jgi:O-antigen/teichoic acid export membrane protein